MEKSKPLISFIILTYNQEQFIEEAIEGAFSQTYSPLEIIISDDNSKDSTFEIIKEISGKYSGPHKIVLNQNKENLGIGGHINRVMELCSGELIVASAGDDISLPERTQKIYEVFAESEGTAMSICSNAVVIDERGEELSYINKSDNLLKSLPAPLKKFKYLFNNPLSHSDFLPENIVKGDYILHGCTHAWNRKIFDSFGPLLTPITFEDRVLPLRSALLGKICYMDEVLVKYRQHANNISQNISHLIITPKKEYQKLLERKKVFFNWIHDIDTYASKNSEQQNNINYIKRIIDNRLEIIQDDILLYKSSWFKRLLIIIKSLLNGVQWSTMRTKIGIYLIPKLYNLYILIKYEK